jgi:hypothetical protein
MHVMSGAIAAAVKGAGITIDSDNPVCDSKRSNDCTPTALERIHESVERM